MAFIEDSAPQKMQASNQARDFFSALASANARRRKFKEKKRKKISFPCDR